MSEESFSGLMFEILDGLMQGTSRLTRHMLRNMRGEHISSRVNDIHDRVLHIEETINEIKLYLLGQDENVSLSCQSYHSSTESLLEP